MKQNQFKKMLQDVTNSSMQENWMQETIEMLVFQQQHQHQMQIDSGAGAPGDPNGPFDLSTHQRVRS